MDRNRTGSGRTSSGGNSRASRGRPDQAGGQSGGLTGLRGAPVVDPGSAPGANAVPGARGGRSSVGSGGASAPTAVGGGSSEVGARFFRGEGAEVSVTGPEKFEPIFDRKLEYVNSNVPEQGESVDLQPLVVGDLLQLIYMSTDWNILATEAVLEIPLNAWTYETSPKEALQILEFNDIYYTFDEPTKYLRVMTRDEWLDKNYGKIEESVFKVKHADIAYAESVVNALISEIGRSVIDQRTNTIYVWDTGDNVSMMSRALQELDVPLEQGEFSIQYAQIGDVEPVLTELLSPAGSMVADPRTGRIIIWDNPSKLEMIGEAVAKLDVPVASRMIEVENVNAEDLIDSLEPMLTERGMMQVDPRYNALIVTDLPQHLERIASVVESLDRELETRTWVVNYADMDFIADSIESLVPPEMGDILLNEDNHQITVTGLPHRLDRIDDLILTWDVRRKQVDIEAFIVGMSTEVERMFNINWSYFDNVGNTPIVINSGEGFTGLANPAGSGETASIGQLPMAIPAAGRPELDSSGNIIRPLLQNIEGGPVIDHITGNNLSVALSYLDQKQKLTVLSSPRIIVQDGEEAIFENVTQVPFISSTSFFDNTVSNNTTNNNLNFNANNTNRVEFVDVGTVLAVLPRITEVNDILLDVRAEDSTFIDKVIVSNDQESTVPEVTVRQAQTQLRVNSGETIVLGGLRRDRAMDMMTKTPFLGDLPLIGKLFRNPNKDSEHSTLMIFITTTVVGEQTSPESELLMRAEDHVASFARYNERDFWGRLQSRLADGEDEINVSIGQSGHLFSEGERVTMDELREAMFNASTEFKPNVLVRKHPKAPADIVVQVSEAAMEAGLKLEFDYSMAPIVPMYSTELDVSPPPPPPNAIQ